MSATDERRIQKRARVELTIDLESYDKYYLTKLKNLSIGGAFVHTREKHTIGTQLTVRFRLPNSAAPIETKAEVMWVYTQAGNREPNSSGIGVKFTDLTRADEDRIARFVLSQTKG